MSINNEPTGDWSMNAAIEHDAQEEAPARIIPAPPKPPAVIQLGTLQADTPVALISGATEISDKLAEIVNKNKLYSNIQGKKYVRVEGWTTLAALLGVIAREDSVEQFEDGSYLATVSLVRMSDGAVISTASAECGMDEARWKTMPRYARRSMAITRATGKAARLAFSWIMALAGFQPTPAEEMDAVVQHEDDDEPLEVIPFGKNAGKKFSELSDKSLSWYAEECNNDRVRHAAQAEVERRMAAAQPENIGAE